LIIDDWAMREFSALQADDVYELICERVGRPGRSLVLTSNRSPSKAHRFARTCARWHLKCTGTSYLVCSSRPTST
jgi:DNA replication protein DnaC